MDAHSTNPADPALRLTKAIYYQVTHSLRRSLPPPITNTPEDEARRDVAAIAHVASLLPVTADEAHLAVQYVVASATALDCQRLAHRHPASPELMLQCFAQSARMAREARSWRLALQRAQAAREKRAANVTASAAAAEAENRTLGLMADVLAQPQPASAPAAAPPQPSPIDEAERYALSHRKRAVLIRRFGRLPDKLDCGAMRPEVVHAIATGSTPILRGLDPGSRREAGLSA